MVACVGLLPQVARADEARAGAQEDATKHDIQRAAQRLEAARRDEKRGDSELQHLGDALRHLRRALAAVASPSSEEGASDALAAVTRGASEFRARCEAVVAQGARDTKMARVASDLAPRCARLLGGVDAVIARPTPRERAAGAAGLLSELATAGPQELDSRRAPREPTARIAQ